MSTTENVPTIVLVTQSHGDPKLAELYEAAPGRPHVRKVIYLHSRTGAWVHTRRIKPAPHVPDPVDPEGPMTRVAHGDGSMPVLSFDGVWAYTWDAVAEHGTQAVATRVATGARTVFVDFDTARRWTHQQSQELDTDDQLRAAGIPIADPVTPAEIEAEVDAIMAESEPERRADRLAAGIVDSYAVEQPPATMTVRVRDRSAEASWGHGLTSPVVRTVTISARCPVCGGQRGVPRNLNQVDDGARYSVDVWRNDCGHVDSYAAVVAEARQMELEVALRVAGYADPLPLPGTDWRDISATWLPSGQRRLVRILSIGKTVNGWQARVWSRIVDVDGTVIDGPTNGIAFLDQMLSYCQPEVTRDDH